jgi:hypothetical protein
MQYKIGKHFIRGLHSSRIWAYKINQQPTKLCVNKSSLNSQLSASPVESWNFVGRSFCPNAKKLLFQKSRYQQIGTFRTLKNLRYSILITTQKGESKPMDLHFLLPQSSIFRASDLTPDLKSR